MCGAGRLSTPAMQPLGSRCAPVSPSTRCKSSRSAISAASTERQGSPMSSTSGQDTDSLAFRPCAASVTGDLLDCDCGFVTTHMKIEILTMLDDHTLHTLDRQLDDG